MIETPGVDCLYCDSSNVAPSIRECEIDADHIEYSVWLDCVDCGQSWRVYVNVSLVGDGLPDSVADVYYRLAK